MSIVYVKRGSVVTTELFDLQRTDQGVSIVFDDAGAFVTATMSSRGRLVNVRPGDMLVTDASGSWPADALSFSGLYQPLEEVVSSIEEVHFATNS